MGETKQFILESGKVQVRKILGIPVGIPKLPEATADSVLVVRDRTGRFLSVERPTSGERAWGNYDMWFLVDVGPQDCERSYDDLLVSADAGFTVKVSITAQVSDPVPAAKNPHRGLASFVDPILRRALDQTVYEFYEQRPEFSPRKADELSHDIDKHGRPNLGTRWFDSEKIYAMRVESQRHLQAALSTQALGGPEWLDMSVTSLSVSIDADTLQHLRTIQSGRRATELTAVSHQNTEAEALSKMKIRSMWRNELKGYLTDRSMRMFEEVYADPTPEKIQEAVARVDASEREQMTQLLGVVNQQVENGTIHSDAGFVDMVAQLKDVHLHDRASSAPEVMSEIASGSSDDDDDYEDRNWK